MTIYCKTPYSLAARRSTGTIRRQFLNFAARKNGRIKNGVAQLDQLRKYYQEKAAAFMEAITQTQNDFWNEQARLDDLASTRQYNHMHDSAIRSSHNIEEEFQLNYAAACAQIGYKPETIKPSLPAYAYTSYTAQVTITGWCNIDRYAEETTIARQSAVYTDRQTGKKATLTYQPVSVQLLQPRQYSRIYVYLLPDKLSSFMRLSDSTGKFAERINQLLTYRLICIGYKDEKAFFYTQADIQSRNYTDIPLNPISDSVLDQQLNALGNRTQVSDLHQETDYFQFEIRDQKRQQRNQALQDLTDKLSRAFFPCFVYMEEAPELSTPYI